MTDVITGTPDDDYLEGGEGNDTLDGGAGNDTLVGGAGDDVYIVDGGDIVVENSDEGTDEVRTSVDWGLVDNVENLAAIEGSAASYLGGNDLDNVITGNSGDNYLVGGRGNDTLDGGDGRDVAAFQLPNGTEGSLQMVAGPDGTQIVQLVHGDGSVEDVFSIAVGGAGAATVIGLGMMADLGTDTVANVEELHFFVDTYPEATPDNQFTFLSLATTQYGDFLAGSAADDIIDMSQYPGALNASGGLGDDTIVGTDSDNFIMGEQGNDIIDGGDGTDVAAFKLPAGTEGSLQVANGPDGTVLVQLVHSDGSFEDVFSVVVSASGAATVTGLGIAADAGTDTVTNVEDLHFMVETGADPTPPEQWTHVSLAAYVPPLQDGFAHVSGSAAGDLIDLEALYPNAGPEVNINANGGAGDDTILGTAGWNYLRGDEGNDTIDGRGGGDSVAFGLPAGMTGTLRVVQGTGPEAGSLVVERVDGDTVEHLFIVSFAADGTATVEGVNSAAFLGTDTVRNAGALDFVVDNAEFDPNQFAHIIIPAGASDGPDAIYGSDDSDYLSGGDGADALYGFLGDDILIAGAGSDFLRGGGGDDIIDGGDGSDRASFYNAPNAVHVDLRLQGQAQDTGEGMDTLVGIESVSGTTSDDTLIGDDNANSLWSSGGNDTLSGNGGDDYLGVGVGDMVLDGGDGSDTIAFVNEDLDAPGPITVDLNISGPQNVGIGAWTISNVENVSGGNFNDRLTGNGADNILAGAIGNDTLNGGAGNDLLLGDGYIAVNGGDPSQSWFVIEDGAEYGAVGNDTLYGGDGDDTIFGGSGNDRVFGDGGNDYIDGGAGDDTINTGFGVNTVYAGDGNDTVFAFADVSLSDTVYVTGDGGNLSVTQGGVITNQIYAAELIQVIVQGSTGPVTVDATGYISEPGTFLWLTDHDGTDVMLGSSGSEGFGNTYTNVTGNDIFTGNGGADIFDYTYALAGMNGDTITDFDVDDTIDLRFNDSANSQYNGGLLADTFIGNAEFSGVAGEYRYATHDGETFVEADSDGDGVADQVLTLANGEYQLSETFAGSNILVRSSAITGTEDADLLTGTDGSDVIDGLGGDDTLRGGLGDDQLYGGAGNDLLSEASGDDGPFGNDLYDGGDGFDRVSYFSNYGLHGVTVDLNVTAAQDTGQGSDTLVGIEHVTSTYGNDTLTGNDDSNWFLTYSGFDTLSGNGGDDYFTVGADDKVIDGGDGVDSVEIADWSDAQVYQNAGGINVSLELQGSAQWVGTGYWTLNNIENLGGFDGNDTLTGDSGANVLAGQLGNDTLAGGAGDDSLYGDGTWILQDGVQTLVEDDVLDGPGGNDTLDGGDGNDYLSGARGDDALYGRAGNDTLDGGDGDDWINGGGGDDVLDGGAGNDTLFGGFGINELRGGDGYDIAFAQVDSSLSNTIYVTGTGGDVSISQGGTLTNHVLDAEEVQVRTEGPPTTLTLDASGYVGTPDTTLWLVDHDGTDIMIGSAGNDSFGNISINVTGSDVFTGFGGSDLFDYTYAVGGMNGDTITDFEFDETIDLRFNDAANLHYEGALLADHFIGNAAFSGIAGEYRYSAHDGQTFVEADTDGDAVADQVLTLSNGEFVLVETFAGSNILKQAASGVAADGLLAGATVFMDVNGNGEWDEGEARTTTGADGRFLFDSPSVGTLVVTGGTNTDTGLPNLVTLTAPIGSGVVNPLTTLVQAVLESAPAGTTADEAAAAVASALGISGSIDLLNTDVYSAAAAGDPDALAAQKAAATVVTLVAATSDAAGSADAGEQAIANLAGLIGSGAGQVDLTDETTIAHVLDGALTPDQVDSVASGVADAAQQIAATTSLDQLSDAQADALTRGNDLDNALSGGAFDDQLFGFGGDDTLAGGAGADRLDGGEGNDTADYSGSSAAVSINLVAHKFSGGDAAGDVLVSIENVTGSAYGDKLIGDQGANVLNGGAGDDTINGGGGADVLWGGGGSDLFVFKTPGEIGSGAGHDVLMDFEAGELSSAIDHIDLSAIDAIARSKKDDAFTFIGDHGFSGKAGELQLVTKDGVGTFSGDVDGDGRADFTFEVHYTGSLGASDIFF